MTSQTVLRTALWLALGGWVGAWAFFAFVVSRLAFQVLPGAGAGALAFVVAGASVALGRRGWVVALPVVLGLLCLGSEIFLSPEVAAVRPSTLGAENTAETQQRFRILHAVSLGLFMAIHAATYILVWGQARLDTLDSRNEA